jgi:hypothetical protein
VAEMPAAAQAVHFRPHRAERPVDRGSDGARQGRQKLGQPVPLSNLVVEANSGLPSAAQTNVPRRCSPAAAR